MEKIKAQIKSKGILVKYLSRGDFVEKDQDIALIQVGNEEVKITSPSNGKIYRLLDEGNQVKKGATVAYLYDEEKNEEQLFDEVMNNENDDSDDFDGEDLGIKFEPFNGKFGAKWGEIEIDDFSGASFSDSPSKSLNVSELTEEEKKDYIEKQIKSEHVYNSSNNYNDNIINDKTEKAINNSIQSRLAKLRGEAGSNNVPDNVPNSSNNKEIKEENSLNTKFRDLVNARRQQLHQKENYRELDLKEDENHKTSAMDFLDADGRPKILRNIVENRMKALIANNGDDSLLSTSDSEDNDVRTNLDNKDNNTTIKDDLVVTGPKKVKSFQKPQSYFGRLSYNLDDEKRQNILRASNQRDVIRQRMEKIASGEVVVDHEILDDFNAYSKRTITELEKQYDEVVDQSTDEVNFDDDAKVDQVVNEQMELEKQESIENNIETKQSPAKEVIVDKESEKVITQSHVQNDANHDINKILTELAVLKEKLNQQEQLNKHMQLLNEINSLKESISNISNKNVNAVPVAPQIPPQPVTVEKSVENSGPNFDKMMQYMMMQQMMKMFGNNGNEAIIADLLKANMNMVHPQPIQQPIQQPISNVSIPQVNSNAQPLPINNVAEIRPVNDISETSHAPSLDKEVEVKTEHSEDLKVKVFNHKSEEFEDTHTLTEHKLQNDAIGNLITSVNKNINVVPTSVKIVEPEGLEKREAIKETKFPAIKSMILSQAYVPPLTINTEVDMSNVLEQQRKFKLANSEIGIRFSTMSFIVKAISLVLTEYPKINAYYDPNNHEVVIKNSHHIGLATETSEGLVVPVIKYVEKLSLKNVAVNIQESIDRLRKGELQDYELQGSTITVANYGTIGAIQATPTLFYPNAALVGFGKIVRKPIVIKGDKISIKPIMNLSLTVDQRIVDAAQAGIFLARLKEILEQPELIALS